MLIQRCRIMLANKDGKFFWIMTLMSVINLNKCKSRHGVGPGIWIYEKFTLDNELRVTVT